MYKQALIILFSIVVISVYGQDEKPTPRTSNSIYLKKIDPSNFDNKLFNEVLLKEINGELDYLKEREFVDNTILSSAAHVYAEYMASVGQSKTGLDDKLSLKNRIEAAGGAAAKATELVLKESIREGKDTLTFAQLAANVMFNLFNKEKTADVLKDYKYIFSGVGSHLDVDGKKVYVSIVLGNHNVNNVGKAEIESSGYDITTKLKYKPYDSKICRSVDRFKEINDLQDGLSVMDGKIVFETERWKEVKKFLKEPTNGFAVDVILRDQYPCSGNNIVDNRLGTKGFVTNMVKQSKLLTMNEIEGKESRSKYKAVLAEMPSVEGKYELNLVIIQEKHLCADVMPTYIEVGKMKNVSQITIIADTLMSISKLGYVPVPDTFDLEFKIPFELGKYDYNPEDVEPFLNALNELEYTILNLKISAFSSIEGEEEKNQELREKRAQTIVDAIKEVKGEEFEVESYTSDSWEMFYTDIESTSFDTLRHMDKETIMEMLRDRHFYDSIEPILAKHRYAIIEMRVIHDLNSDKKEQEFVMMKFQQTVDSNDYVQALKIQKYIMKKAMRKKYEPEVASLMKLPKDSANFSGIQMNQLWLDYAANDKPIDSLFWAEVMRLQNIDPENDYIAYNRVYCEIKFNPIVDEMQISQMQRIINDLATSSLQKSDVDRLNLEYQLKILHSIDDTFEPSNKKELTKTVVDRIKQIVDFKDNDSQSALDLAYLFVNMHDYYFAMQILEPFIYNKEIDENVIFTYISICTNIKDKFQTEIFEKALIKASKINVDRLCNLLREGQFSYQFFENPNVKGVFCKTCFE